MRLLTKPSRLKQEPYEQVKKPFYAGRAVVSGETIRHPQHQPSEHSQHLVLAGNRIIGIVFVY